MSTPSGARRRVAMFVIAAAMALDAPGLSALPGQLQLRSPQLDQPNRVWQSAMEHAKQGNLREAILRGEAAFSEANPLWTATDETRVIWAERIAGWQEELGDFTAAIVKRTIARDSLASIAGEGHWIVREAGLTIERVAWKAAATALQLESLENARREIALALTLAQKKEFREAAATAQRATEILEQLFGQGDWRTEDSIELAAFASRQLGDHMRALGLLEHLLAIRSKAYGEQSPKAADTLNSLASLHQVTSEFAKAEAAFSKAIEAGRAAYGRVHPSMLPALRGLGSVCAILGNYPRAEAALLQVVAFERETNGPAHPATARAIANLGLLYRKSGDLAKAEAHYEQALAIQRKALGDDDLDTLATSMNLGMLYRDREEHIRALLLIERAHASVVRLLGPADARTIIATSNLASALEDTGEYARAGLLYEQALASARDSLGPEHHDTLTILHNLALMHVRLGDRARAAPLFQEVLAGMRRAYGSSHPEVATVLHNLGTHYLAARDFSRAEAHLIEALDIRRQVFGEMHAYTATDLDALGGLHMDRGALTRAQLLFEQAIAVRRAAFGDSSPTLVPSLNNLALLHSERGDLSKAGSLHEQALQIAKNGLGPDHPLTATMTTNLARTRADAGNHAEAIDLAGSALRSARKSMGIASLVQSDRQQLAMAASLRSQLDNYLSFAPAAAAPAEAAWDHVIAWKGMVLARQRAVRAAAGRPELQAQFEELRAVASELARLALAVPDAPQQGAARERLSGLSERKERIEADLSRESAAFGKARETVTARALMASLPDGTAIVDFVEYWHQLPGSRLSQRRLLAFVATRTIARMIPLGAVVPLSSAIDEWRAGYGTMAASLKAGQFLRAEIWTPIEHALSDSPAVTRIILSPDGILGRLPVAALPGKARGSYVFDDWIIATIPATQLLPEMLGLSAAPAREGLLALGNVDYAGRVETQAQPAAVRSRSAARDGAPTFDPLPGTRDEVLAIDATYRRRFKADAMLLAGSNAAESAVRREAPRHRYLHLATHGFFAAPQFQSALERRAGPAGASTAADGASPIAGYHPGLLSGLVLAGANTPTADDDGILTAEEVGTLDLSGVDLAVLSACETGLGQIAGGEGLLGLQRPFHTAGARTVIATMWKVDDDATRAFMERFYENLWTKKMGKLEALREAQMWMRKERPSPFYWAAFVMSGDWR